MERDPKRINLDMQIPLAVRRTKDLFYFTTDKLSRLYTKNSLPNRSTSIYVSTNQQSNVCCVCHDVTNCNMRNDPTSVGVHNGISYNQYIMIVLFTACAKSYLSSFHGRIPHWVAFCFLERWAGIYLNISTVHLRPGNFLGENSGMENQVPLSLQKREWSLEFASRDPKGLILICKFH
ncbi:hypothetical protein CEXT_78961 [Caerostris extrusa]|uniref:Uncharacterized protein n=1 Tax=Caerostris extrusa TaxID=172846 RepID=A0AAV4PRU5_CAEEX|nr:hypothetical protein CEXT_78961 [Caerostris extrusa]